MTATSTVTGTSEATTAYDIIDVDTHITEPPDVWTSRVPRRYVDRVPQVRRVAGADLWFLGDEQIGAVEARPDRMALYRGRQLHSGIIPDPAALSDDPARGRLTINMFLFGS